MKQLLPESKWVVKVDEHSIKSIDYNGDQQTILYSEIEKIVIETNDSGPWETDLWWRIYTKGACLSVPGGATGDSEMLKAFQLMKGFDNEMLIESMTSTVNAEFVVFERNEL